MLEAITSDSSFDKYGGIEITVEPDRDSVRRVLEIPHLRKLDIVVVRPNPDDLQDAERRVMERLGRQDARQMDIVLYAEKNGDLDPDEDTKTLAEVAARNGRVVGSGRDVNNVAITKSTTDKPWQDYVRFDDEVQTEESALLEHARMVNQGFGG